MTTAFFHPDWGALNLPQLAAMVGPEHEVMIVDNWHGLFKQEGVRQSLKSFRPDILGISNSTVADTERVLGMVREIRSIDPTLFMVAGGQAAAVYYRECLNAGFDLVVMGEGELTFKEIVERFSRGSRDFSDILGVAYRDESDYQVRPGRPFVENLDDLPFPAWELMPRFKSKFFSNTYVSTIETSRGCPFGCSFCSIQAFWNRTYRKKSNRRIIEELRYLKNHLGFEQVYFIDDSFALNIKEYTELFEMMIRENLVVRGFSQIRPDTVANNPEMIKLAARAGFWGFLVGFDSYEESELKRVGKTGGHEVNIRAAEVLRENNISVFGAHMFGMPGGRTENFRKTFEFGMRNSDTFRMSRFSLIPGTLLFEKLSQCGLVEERKGSYVPYRHRVKAKLKESWKVNFLYVWYELRSLLGLRAILGLFASKGMARRFKLRAYIVAARYIFYLFCRKIGIPFL